MIKERLQERRRMRLLRIRSIWILIYVDRNTLGSNLQFTLLHPKGVGMTIGYSTHPLMRNAQPRLLTALQQHTKTKVVTLRVGRQTKFYAWLARTTPGMVSPKR